jgi:hypothetical protein
MATNLRHLFVGFILLLLTVPSMQAQTVASIRELPLKPDDAADVTSVSGADRRTPIPDLSPSLLAGSERALQGAATPDSRPPVRDAMTATLRQQSNAARSWRARHPILAGALIGAGSGAILGAVLSPTEKDDFVCNIGPCSRTGYALIGAGFGAGVGALVGLAF